MSGKDNLISTCSLNLPMDRSFGITMWEIFSFGEKPYNGMKHNDLKAFLKREERIGVSAILIETSCSAVVYIANMRTLHIWHIHLQGTCTLSKRAKCKGECQESLWWNHVEVSFYVLCYPKKYFYDWILPCKFRLNNTSQIFQMLEEEARTEARVWRIGQTHYSRDQKTRCWIHVK